MSFAAVQRILGLLLTVFSFTLMPPFLVSLFAQDGSAVAFATAFALTLGIGIISWLPVRHKRRELRLRDGFVVVVMFWTVLSAIGALPFVLADHPHLSLTDAVFESVSGLTTTGATVITNLEGLPRSILYYRQQLQWLGGMGIIVLAVAVLPMLGIGGMQLYRAETPGPMKDSKLTPAYHRDGQGVVVHLPGADDRLWPGLLAGRHERFRRGRHTRSRPWQSAAFRPTMPAWAISTVR